MATAWHHVGHALADNDALTYGEINQLVQRAGYEEIHGLDQQGTGIGHLQNIVYASLQ